MNKIFFLIVISLLLSSCSIGFSGAHPDKNVISLRMKNGDRGNYRLLSVRDSSLVVFPTDEMYDESTSISHALVIQDDSITKITTAGPSPLIPTIIGAAVGTVAGVVASQVIPHPSACETCPKSPIFAGYLILSGVVGGAAVGYLITPQYSHYDPADRNDIYSLRKISRYPNGEPEMLKLVH